MSGQVPFRVLGEPEGDLRGDLAVRVFHVSAPFEVSLYRAAVVRAVHVLGFAYLVASVPAVSHLNSRHGKRELELNRERVLPSYDNQLHGSSFRRAEISPLSLSSLDTTCSMPPGVVGSSWSMMVLWLAWVSRLARACACLCLFHGRRTNTVARMPATAQLTHALYRFWLTRKSYTANAR